MKDRISGFLNELVIQELKEEGKWELQSDLSYFSLLINEVITIKAGFITDFASTPRVPFVFWFWGDRAHREAVLHDWLYYTGVVPRSVADRIFLEAMKARKKSLFLRMGMYFGVRAGGWVAWRKHRKNNH